MKQEAINTFSEGLNYDINIATTPNNILTDCINGTFLTFNGDELSLQNDAGNTVIPIPVTAVQYDPLHPYSLGNKVYTAASRFYECISLEDTTAPLTDTTAWKEFAVRLSDGFYPIGVKEYGGILYIVSAKEPDIVAEEFNDAHSYAKGAVVYTHTIDTDYYYESLRNGNQEPLPYESNSSWFLIGVKKDFINRYGKIEFGSYPSPEIIDATKLDTSLVYEINNDNTTPEVEFKNKLYTPKIINNATFRAGVYVQFNANDIGLVTTDITARAFTYDAITKVVEETTSQRAIYKVKLLHQLTNGFIDLTDDVWEKYAIYYKTTTGFNLNTNTAANGTHYWFSDPNFKYYCPHNFKGKLAISVEIEELDVFVIYPVTVEIENDTYLVTFSIEYENNTKWNEGITNYSVAMIYTLDGSEPTFDLPLHLVLNGSNQVSHSGVLPTFTIPIGPVSTFPDAVLRYKILPYFHYELGTIPFQHFPQKYLDMHLLSGSKLLSNLLQDFAIKIEEEFNTCDNDGSGFRTVNVISITDGDGNYITNEGDLSPTAKYQFILEGIDEPIAPDVWVGKYSIDPVTLKATVIEYNTVLYPLVNKSYFETLVQDTTVQKYDRQCSEALLTIIINAEINNNTILPLKVSQSSGNKSLVRKSNTSFECWVKKGEDITITPIAGLGVLTTPYTMTGGITEDETINFGLILDLMLRTTDIYEAPNIFADYFYVDLPEVYFGMQLPENTGQIHYTAEQTNISYDPILLGPSIVSGLSKPLLISPPVSGWPEYTVNIYSTYPNESFINLPANTFKTKENGILLKNSYTLIRS